jgi:hypothetical protein
MSSEQLMAAHGGGSEQEKGSDKKRGPPTAVDKPLLLCCIEMNQFLYICAFSELRGDPLSQKGIFKWKFNLNALAWISQRRQIFERRSAFARSDINFFREIRGSWSVEKGYSYEWGSSTKWIFWGTVVCFFKTLEDYVTTHEGIANSLLQNAQRKMKLINGIRQHCELFP